ncbi:hypothetical protein, partial [Clostridium chromiireducens]|uniref:hypothetical protein n=1 Tax=Clostridium chromiireducens TaxID=225345 RepID=UPI001116099F
MTYISYVSIIIIVAIILRRRNNFRITIIDSIIGLVYVFILIINLINNGIQPLFISNFYSQGMANLSVVIYILMLANENRGGLKNFILKDLFIILNTYFIINIPILIKQLDYTYFLMRNVQSNSMYEDHVTGLIGTSGTHELTFYWIVLTIVNLYKYSQKKNKKILILTCAYVVFMFIISSQNDNTAYFILFPMII